MTNITTEAKPTAVGKGVKKVSALVQENLQLFSLLKRVEPHLEKLYNEVGIKSPHTRHFVHLFQDALDLAKPGHSLDLGFDQLKADAAAIQEVYDGHTEQEKTVLHGVQIALSRELEKMEKGDAFVEHFSKRMSNLCELFWKHLESPDVFHERKWAWLEETNQLLMSFPKKPHYPAGYQKIR
jgi:hypothetical protein